MQPVLDELAESHFVGAAHLQQWVRVTLQTLNLRCHYQQQPRRRQAAHQRLQPSKPAVRRTCFAMQYALSFVALVFSGSPVEA